VLPTNAHKRKRNMLRNHVSRVEVETIIMLVINTHPGQLCFVKDFVLLAKFMESAATDKQLSYVAYQMSETGELQRYSRGGDYGYRWWADPPLTDERSENSGDR